MSLNLESVFLESIKMISLVFKYTYPASDAQWSKAVALKLFL